MNWISVKDRLPPYGLMVLIHYDSYIGFGSREDDTDRWLWGRSYGSIVDIAHIDDSNWHDVEVDDDYQVTHWAFIISPPKEDGE